MIKIIITFCVSLVFAASLSAKIVIVDTTKGEKLVRLFALGMTPARKIEIKKMKMKDALIELHQGKAHLLISNDRLEFKSRKKYQVNCYRYALEPIFLLVNTVNKVNNISSKHLREVLEGRITNWKELGDKSYGIHLTMTDKEQIGMRTLYEKIIPAKDIRAKFFEVSDAHGVSVLTAAQQSMLGVCGLSPISLSVKRLSIDGVAPTFANIRSGKYKGVREFWIWTSEQEKHKKNILHQEARKIVELLRDSENNKLIERCGFLPHREKGE